jgi:hypothetical protein
VLTREEIGQLIGASRETATQDYHAHLPYTSLRVYFGGRE